MIATLFLEYLGNLCSVYPIVFETELPSFIPLDYTRSSATTEKQRVNCTHVILRWLTDGAID